MAVSVYRRLGDWPDLAALPQPRGADAPAACRTAPRRPAPGADITLWARIDACNRGITDPATCLGWLGEGGLGHLQAIDSWGSCSARETAGSTPAARCPLRLFMATTNSEIARSDCLFYAVPA